MTTKWYFAVTMCSYFNTKLFFTDWICGPTRLGNKLSMIAAAIAAAVSKNMTFVLVQNDASCRWMGSLQSLFVNVANRVPVLPASAMTKWKSFGEDGLFTNVSEIIRRDYNFTITGFRQTWKYMATPKEQAAVRTTFQFTERYNNHAVRALTTAKQAFPQITNPILVGLHMRMGDIQKNTYGWQMANKTFYDHVLKVAYSFFHESSNIIFVAGSDSPSLGKQMLADAQSLYNIFWLSGDTFEDFAALSHCNHSVISGGTYGLWAAWLAGGETFHFANFSKRGTPFARGFHGEHFYWPQWHPVSWW